MKQNAVIKTRKQKAVEKAVLMSKQLVIDYDGGGEGFTVNVAAFVPKAALKKPMPKLALTMDVADDKIRCVSGSVAELAELHMQIAKWLLENEATLQMKVLEEQKAWLDLHQTYQQAQLTRLSKLQVV